ncbi:unnamed protein product [Blepharisma stoltei]|uniref:Casein kinase I n=1 Tax=Blepharisma stoltei TaxID=1481888 RepID=A0AAU9KCV1_9CILI|nr:unnamed protein product [Blepharisma stoltei]
MEFRFGGKFRLSRKLADGAFSEVYLGINVLKNEEVAIKLEKINSKNPQLIYESKIYKLLYGQRGIAKLHWCGVEGDNNVLVLDLLGLSLEELFRSCNKKFSLKTVLQIADEIIPLIEMFHNKALIHRDIKPDNFLTGIRTNANQIFMIDFGMCKKFRKGGSHIPYREGKKFIGTARYTSISAHLGIELSRRDDLESLAYTLLYFIKGSLPWQGVRAFTKKEKYDRIVEKKMSTSIESLCYGVPIELENLLRYARSLRFEDKPEYSHIKRQFRALAQRENLLYDFVFDWTILHSHQTVRPSRREEQKNDHIGRLRASSIDSAIMKN